MFPVMDFLEIGWVSRSDFFFFFLHPSLSGDAHVGYFCAAKQNKQILHKQYSFSYSRLLCADQNAEKIFLAVLFIDKKNSGRQILKKKTRVDT